MKGTDNYGKFFRGKAKSFFLLIFSCVLVAAITGVMLWYAVLKEMRKKNRLFMTDR